MRSVGEAMAIGRTFKQAFAKALRSRELDKQPSVSELTDGQLLESAAIPGPERFEVLLELLRREVELEEVQEATMIDPWFLRELRGLARDPGTACEGERSFRSVDTCAAEFPARTPYYYSGWERRAANEVRRGERESVVILGAGPNRIGQGIEFDYCCVHAAMTVRESGRDAVMINCNPETVSTDYDTSDRLYFEPLTLEDVLAVVEQERPLGVVVQFGGQTPLKLASGLEQAGVPLLGTSVEAIDLAEDRSRFGKLLDELGYKAPPYATASSVEEALASAETVGFPLLVRPSYVLGGRAMEIVYSQDDLAGYLRREAGGGRADLPRPLPRGLARGGRGRPLRPRAGLDRGDHAARRGGRGALRRQRLRAAPALAGRRDARPDPRGHARHRAGDRGRRADQRPVRDPRRRAVRDRGQPPRLAHGAVRLQGGRRCRWRSWPAGSCSARRSPPSACPPSARASGSADHVSVKEAVLPFDRFEGSDALLGPEMRSTGEVMGIARDFPTAFAKAQAAAGVPLPRSGTVFITVTDEDKTAAAGIAQTLHDNGFRILATRGTAQAISRMGVPVQPLNKLGEGSPHVLDWIERGEVDLVVNTPTGVGARSDGHEIRRAAVAHGIPCLTTLAAGASAARAIARAQRDGEPEVLCLQELHREPRGAWEAGERPRPRTRPAPAGPAWRELEPGDRATRTPPAGGRRQRAAGHLPPAAGARPRRRLRPGAVRDARRRAALGGGRGRAAVPAAGASRSPATAARRPTSCSRTSAPGPPAVRAAPGDGCSASGRWDAASRPPRRAGGRCWSAAASGSRRW